MWAIFKSTTIPILILKLEIQNRLNVNYLIVKKDISPFLYDMYHNDKIRRYQKKFPTTGHQ